MAQILPQYQSSAEQFASGFGGGLSSGLQSVLQSRIQDLASKASIERSYQALVKGGVPDQEARFLSTFAQNPSSQVKLLDALWKREQPAQSGMIGGLPQAQEQPSIDQLVGNVGNIPAAGGLDQFLTDLKFNQPSQAGISSLPQAEPIGQMAGTEPAIPQKQNLPPSNRPLTAYEKLLQPPRLSRSEEIRKQQGEENIKLSKERNEISREKLKGQYITEARKFLEPHEERRRALVQQNKLYDEALGLVKSGKAKMGQTQQALSALGLSDFFQNPTEEQLKKIAGLQARGIGKTFGGRVTNYLEQTFQRAFPGLWNSPEGFVAIANMNKHANDAEIAIEDAYTEVAKKYHGQSLPEDVDAQARAIYEPKVAALEAKVKNEADLLLSPVLKTQNSEPTAAEVGNNVFRNNESGKYYKYIDGKKTKVEKINGKWQAI